MAAASARCCVPWLTICAITCHDILSCGSPSVELYLNLLSSFSSVIPFTKDIKAFSSSAQRVRSESNVGKSLGLNRFVGDVPSQRWRQTHSANNVWTSVPRKPPYGKDADARNSSWVTFAVAFKMSAFAH